MNLSETVETVDNFPLPSSEEIYQAFRRSLQRRKGFGILFVQCSPDQGEELIDKVQEDLPQKQTEVLKFDQPIPNGNFYQQVENFLSQKQKVDILFIQGLEFSLYDYEETKRHLGWNSQDIYSYSWKGVPPILANLNQQRERFRDNFNTCFVFLVPLFVIKYFIHRAPDFFDWRSGLFEIPMNLEELEQEAERILNESKDERYWKEQTFQQRTEKLLEIQRLLGERNQTLKHKAELYDFQGMLLGLIREYEGAIASYNQVIEFKPDNFKAWQDRGRGLLNLGRYEEAISSYDKAIEFKLNNCHLWYERGQALFALKRYEEANVSYSKAIELKSEYHYIWNSYGRTLYQLEDYENAINSYNKAIELKPDNYQAWFHRGLALKKLERYEEAVASFDKAIELKPSFAYWYERGLALKKLERYEEAVASFDKAIELKPSFAYWYERGLALKKLERYEEAVASFDKVIELKSDFYPAWGVRGYSFYGMGRLKESLDSFKKVIEIKPNASQAWSNLGYLLMVEDSYGERIIYEKALAIRSTNKKLVRFDLGKYEEALTYFDKAIEHNAELALVWGNRSFPLHYLGRFEEALVSCNQAASLNLEDEIIWSNRGFILLKLNRYLEAATSFSKALEIQAEFPNALYGLACCYGLQGEVELAIEHLQRAIELDAECREYAKTDADFDAIREDDRFQALISEGE